MTLTDGHHDTPTTSLDVALSYARRGWRVIPIPSGEKFPRGITAWQTEGSTDEAKITHWWTAAPDHGIGIVTGATSGLWVLDVDVAGDKVGDETLADLCDAYGPLPDTYEVVTGSGGRHLYFAWPGGQIVTNSASGRLGPGLDVRGEGGFVVAPPSLHACGQRYEHEASSPTHVAPAPPWLLALLEAPEPAATPTPRQASGPVGDRPGDLWAASTTWAQILEPDGWTLHHVSSDGEEHWTRPGKERRDGTSATTGYLGSDVLKVFTSSHPTLNADETYTKIGYLASTKHHGDHSAAAAALRNDGWKAPDAGLSSLLAPGMAAPAAATTATPAEPWQEPQPLPAPPSVPDFPLTSLPAFAQAHAVAAAEQVQVPADLTAMGIIGALSAACTGRARVHASPNWTEPVNLYTVVAMRSGAGKSPAEKLTVGWLRRWQKDRLDKAKADHDKALLKVRHARKKLAKLEGSESADERDLFAAYDNLATAEQNVPILPRLLADDATPQAIALLLAAHGQRLAITSTEADLFDMLLRGKPDQRADMNIYLKAWSGDEYIRDRKGGQDSGPEWSVLTNPLLSVSVTVQPSVLTKVLTDASMVSRGFAARFMFAIPADLIGQRDQSRRFTTERLATIDTYESTCRALADRWGSWANPAHLHLSAGARAHLEAFLVEIEPQLAAGEEMETLAEWVNKLHASIARYAGLLHLSEGTDTGVEISDDTMRRAIELGRYWLAHALAVSAIEGDAVVEQAQGILEWIASQGTGSVTLSEIQAGHRRPGMGLDKVADYIPAMSLLLELGWMRHVAPDGTAITSGQPDWREGIGIRRAASPRFALWPDAIGRPLSARIPRNPRTASMGERDSLLPSTDAAPSQEPRGTRFTRTDEPPPVDNAHPPLVLDVPEGSLLA